MPDKEKVVVTGAAYLFVFRGIVGHIISAHHKHISPAFFSKEMGMECVKSGITQGYIDEVEALVIRKQIIDSELPAKIDREILDSINELVTNVVKFIEESVRNPPSTGVVSNYAAYLSRNSNN